MNLSVDNATRCFIIGLYLSLSLSLAAQTLQVNLAAESNGTIPIRAQGVSRATIRPEGSSTLLITGKPRFTAAILEPNNTRVTEATAANRGYQFQSTTITPESSGVPLPTGTMVAVQFPSSIATGDYQIELTSQDGVADTAVYIMRHASNLRFQIVSENPFFNEDQDNPIHAVLFNGNAPVTNAQVSAEVNCRRSVTPQVDIVSWRAVASELVGDQRISRSVIQARSNATGNLNETILRLVPTNPAWSAEPDIIEIGQLAPGATWTSPEIIVTQPRGAFQPAFETFFEARGQITTINLGDTGDGVVDGRSGDGVYSAQFRPTTAGTCSVSLKATGQIAGVAFERTAAQNFPVAAVSGSLGSIEDYTEDPNGDGKPEFAGLRVRVNARRAGQYQVAATLFRGDRYLELRSEATLPAGAQSVVLKESAETIRVQLGDSGPFQRRDLQLLFKQEENFVLSDSRDDAGSTAAWSLGGATQSVLPDGPASIAPFPTTLPPDGYTSLKFRIPVKVLRQAAECSAYVVIGNRTQELQAGFNIYFAPSEPFPFRYIIEDEVPSWKIRRAQAGGAFFIQEAKVSCGGPLEEWSAKNIANTAPIRAADLKQVLPDFSLTFNTLDNALLTFNRAANQTNRFYFEVDPVADFENNLSCTVSPTYPGITTTFLKNPVPQFDWPVTIDVLVTPQAATGPAPMTVSCTGRGITKTAPLNVVVQ
jgi:hypothetical protein